jgi:hypothetical protein
MFRPDMRNIGKGIVINTTPATGLSISCMINGIIMCMFRNTRRYINTTTGMTTRVIVGTAKVMTRRITMGRAEVTTRRITGGMTEVTTETKQDQINYNSSSVHFPLNCCLLDVCRSTVSAYPYSRFSTWLLRR